MWVVTLCACSAPPEALPRAEALTSAPFLPVLSPHRIAVFEDHILVSDPEGADADGRSPAVYLLSIARGEVTARMRLPDGSNPGAIEVNRATGWGYVVARGSGGLYPIDLADGAVGTLIPTCASPIDLAPAGRAMVVACMTGELVNVEADGTTALLEATGRRLTAVAIDAWGRIFAGTQDGQVIEVRTHDTVVEAIPGHDATLPNASSVAPNSVRRMVALKEPGTLALYQESVAGLPPPPDPFVPVRPPPSYAGGAASAFSDLDCSGAAARAMVGAWMPNGGQIRVEPTTAALAVDLALAEDGKMIAIADAAGAAVELVGGAPWSLGQTASSGCGGNRELPRIRIRIDEPMGVAFASDQRLVILSGTPSLHVVLHPVNGAGNRADRVIPIRPRTVPAGFRLFHTRAGTDSHSVPELIAGTTGIACATCHPDGLSTGAVLSDAKGMRRVMALAGRITPNSRMHWEGKGFTEAIAIDTWQTQMGQKALRPNDEASLRDFVLQLQLPPRAGSHDPAGEAAFAKASCATCHTPTNGFTNDGHADVGLGLHKVPSLRGLVFSAPYMSNGCLPELDDRFTAACGAGRDQHGTISVLDAAERRSLIAYLKTL